MTAGTLIALVGAVVLRLTASGAYLRYVQNAMRPWLLIAGVTLVVLGVVTFLRSMLASSADDAEDRPRAGWLLLAPIAVLLLVAPPALGSYGVDRSAPVNVRSGGGEFAPLPKTAEPAAMSLLEYGQRAFDGDGRTVRDATVSLTGFVAGGADSTSCCAADAAAMIVKVVGIAGRAPGRDQWVTVTGRFHPSSGDTPELTGLTVQPIPAPEDPYE